MNQFYQSPINSYFKNNKDCITGLIIGLLVLLVVVRQSIGLPLLFIYLIAIGGLVKPRKEYLVIAGLLVIKILIITIICKNNLQDINEPNLKEWFRKIIIDVFLLFMIFIRLRPSIKKGFYYLCIAVGVLDLVFNTYAHIYGISINGIPLEIRAGDWIGRSRGLFGHSFYSIDISLVALFSALLLKSRYQVPLLLLSVVNLFLAGSQRGLLALAVIIILYIFFYWRIKKAYLYLVMIGLVAAVFTGVAYLAANHPELSAQNERVFRWRYGYEVIVQNWEQLSTYLRINPQLFTPHTPSLLNSPFYLQHPLFIINAESYYLSEVVNYGMIVGLLSVLIFFSIYKINSQLNDGLLKLSSPHSPESLVNLGDLSKQHSLMMVPLLMSFFIFIEGFYGYLMGAAYLAFFYANVCFEGNGEA
jgi:hypothetical protein